MHIGWPQGIYLGLFFVGLGLVWAKHGEPKTGKHDVVSSLSASLLMLGLLWWGGFFS